MPTVADIFLSSHHPSARKCSDVVSRNFNSISPWSELKVNPSSMKYCLSIRQNVNPGAHFSKVIKSCSGFLYDGGFKSF